MAFPMVTVPVQVQVPAGTVTVSPLAADPTAAATAAELQLLAAIVAALTDEDQAIRTNAATEMTKCFTFNLQNLWIDPHAQRGAIRPSKVYARPSCFS